MQLDKRYRVINRTLTIDRDGSRLSAGIGLSRLVFGLPNEY